MVLQQDGALPHIVRNYFNETFPGRWVVRGSPRFLAERSPDLTPLDLFAWGYTKTQVYKVKIRGFQHLRGRISAAAPTITPSFVAACVQVHRGAILLGYGRQSCRTAVISFNYGVFFRVINISFEIKCSFPEIVRNFSGTLYYRRTLATMSHDNSDAVGIIMPGTCHA